ncbi:L-type lectin-domain containing receptor kinase VII.1 [Acorus calamus]|uniref:L-type lectin-domain containing receptor kinase VII.1 n=1 Tax=Acorus calamus TaxID=4465 RepID=A0AAV9F8I0_ACOCL|nr:L-type lectin-domain containing receptor kinase VII.1 [Acorus calamus]
MEFNHEGTEAGTARIYKGVLKDKEGGVVPVVIKCFAAENGESVKWFLFEISTLGRLKHRNLVSLIGWSKQEGGNLILVYEYMENGSLDRRIFDESEPLDWEFEGQDLKATWRRVWCTFTRGGSSGCSPGTSRQAM